MSGSLWPRLREARQDFLLAHEIAHQWWFGLVGNDQLREPWLDEGLANWSAWSYLRKGWQERAARIARTTRPTWGAACPR